MLNPAVKVKDAALMFNKTIYSVFKYESFAVTVV